MAITKEVVEQIRQAVNIVDVIDHYVPLKRAGSHYKALSPFKKEKTPSFMVNPQLQLFKCFSSGHGGDVFKFLQLYENVDFPTAVRRIAEQAGIRVDEGATPEERREHGRRERLLAVHHRVREYWSNLLERAEDAHVARNYLHEREIPLSWIKDYGLGYAPDSWDDLIRWGRQQGFDEELLFDAGLLVKSENGRVYDRFRGRLVFPICDDGGRTIAFSGRMLNPDAKGGKYINSPETAIFLKSRVLFAMDRAKRPILDEDMVVVCEGQIDVLRCHSVGIRHVVAPLGTSFTPEHCRAINRLTKNVVLCLDADSAGSNAADRTARLFFGQEAGIETLIQGDLGVRVVRLPSGEDPDSIIRKEGVESFRRLLGAPMEYVDFLVSHLRSRFDMATVAGRQSIVSEVSRFLSGVRNESLKEQLLSRAAIQLQISPSALKSELGSHRTRAPREHHEKRGAAEEVQVLEFRPHPIVGEMVQLIVGKVDLIPELQRILDPEWVRDLPGSDLLFLVLDLYTHDQWDGIGGLIGQVDASRQNYLAGLNFEDLEKLDISESVVIERMKHACRRLELEWINGQLALVSQTLKLPALSASQQADCLKRQTDLVNRQRGLTSLKNPLTLS